MSSPQAFSRAEAEQIILELGDSKQPETEIQAPKWPELPEAALRGLVGDFVRSIEPHSEADPVALLVQFLVAFGSVIGRTANRVEADTHYMNLYVALVGETSRGRKGTSWRHIYRLFSDVDPGWSVASGLSSGEGLIHRVRDAREETKPIRQKGRHTGEYESTIVDHGIQDKRVLVQEPELARTLRVCNRDTNTLSPIIRAAWDTGDLENLTKNATEKATGAHISIVGHITKDELLRHLDSTELANGFANRFIYTCCQRSKFLPEGGSFSASSNLQERLRVAVDFARQGSEIRKDDETRAAWASVYRELSAGKPGLLGAVTARAEAQTMRLASIYALLDSSFLIRVEHLRAALALWSYSEGSASFIFGDTLGDPVADEILRAVRSAGTDGLTRTEISKLFSRNQSSAQLARAINSLISRNLVKLVKDPDGPGRPVERIVRVI